ncbi:MAG: polysaccharide deacetylase family protein [Actinomycetales bacterium]|nr:polysaccharide deacetylase family protein [Actinomycetales bacterium]
MAVLRARALAVAVGVPALFAVLAATLTLNTQTTPARAAEPAADPFAVSSTAAPFSVTRQSADYRPMVRYFTIPTTDDVAFITIDDGVVKDRKGLRYVEKHQLPITSFISTWTIKDQADFFTRISQWGSIQNHSATHADFTKPSTDLNHELCYSQRALHKAFGSTSWMLRPPYGAGGDMLATQITAQGCGLNRIVMWDAVVQNGHVTVSGGKLGPGAVILLHFNDHLEKDLKAAVKAIHKAGLRPANLADYLPAASSA